MTDFSAGLLVGMGTIAYFAVGLFMGRMTLHAAAPDVMTWRDWLGMAALVLFWPAFFAWAAVTSVRGD